MLRNCCHDTLAWQLGAIGTGKLTIRCLGWSSRCPSSFLSLLCAENRSAFFPHARLVVQLFFSKKKRWRCVRPMDVANRLLCYEVGDNGTTCLWCTWPNHDNHVDRAVVAYLVARANCEKPASFARWSSECSRRCWVMVLTCVFLYVINLEAGQQAQGH